MLTRRMLERRKLSRQGEGEIGWELGGYEARQARGLIKPRGSYSSRLG